jgi:hypothetical protein
MLIRFGGALSGIAGKQSDLMPAPAQFITQTNHLKPGRRGKGSHGSKVFSIQNPSDTMQ